MFRFKDSPGVAMLDMAVCFALESIGLWSVYSALPPDSLIVAAYVFVSIFSLTFMKDFKDVAGDINSLPLKVGIHKAAVICSLLTILPMIPLLYAATSFPRLYLASLIYLVLAARCV